MAIDTYYGKTVTINGSAVSTEIDLEEQTLVGFFLPASMAGTSLTFTTASSSGGMFVTMNDTSNNAISVTISAGGAAKYYAVNPTTFSGIRYLKIVSSTTETSKTITLATRRIMSSLH